MFTEKPVPKHKGKNKLIKTLTSRYFKKETWQLNAIPDLRLVLEGEKKVYKGHYCVN